MRVIARRLLVKGRVQGVFYRNWTVETARRLGVSGWVMNLRSGDVEILAIGAEAALDALIDACHEGPSAARVEDIEVSDADAEPLDGFSKRPTA